jgi:excisionase family DNA binding protein
MSSSPPERSLLTIREAAAALGVSVSHIKRLIHEADLDRRSRWRFGREIIDLSHKGSLRRTLRINVYAVAQELVSSAR